MYKELDLLPEVQVTEEESYASAERNEKGSQKIYQHTITSQQAKFASINDYTKAVDISNSSCISEW
jgi:hypothetical protein